MTRLDWYYLVYNLRELGDHCTKGDFRTLAPP